MENIGPVEDIEEANTGNGNIKKPNIGGEDIIEKSNFRVIGQKVDEKPFSNYYEPLSPKEEELIEKFEHPKSKEEIAIIKSVNKETNRLMEESGVDSYNIPPENYHILPSEIVEKIEEKKGIAGVVRPMSQKIILNAGRIREIFVYLGLVAFHETAHLKEFLSIKAKIQEKDKKIKKRFYRRRGISIDSFKIRKFYGLDHLPPLEYLEYYRYFEGLDEAIVAEMEKRFFKKLINLPELVKEKEVFMSEEVKKIKKEIAEQNNIPEDEIFWITKEQGTMYRCDIFSYPHQRKVLNYLCEEIQKEFPDEYQSLDDVFKEFIKLHFTGRLLLIGRLVEKTFGKGSFRMLGKMDLDEENSFLTLEDLKQRRKSVKN